LTSLTLKVETHKVYGGACETINLRELSGPAEEGCTVIIFCLLCTVTCLLDF